MTRRMFHLEFCLAVLLAAAAGAQKPGATERETGCRGTDGNLAWAQQALDAWRTASRDVLALAATPLPRMVLFDAACVWHLGAGAPLSAAPGAGSPLRFAGEPVAVRGAPHGASIRLPDGKEVPTRPMAFASVYEGGRSPFFVLALLELWRAEHPDLDPDKAAGFFLGVAVHELVHTRQIVAMGRRVEALQAAHELPEAIGDTVVEERFRELPAFAEALEAERRAFLTAAAADPERRRTLAAEALNALRQRRARYLTGADAPYAEIEDLFLAMEGLAVWTHAELARLDLGVLIFPDHPAGLSERQVLEIMRQHGGEWVQHAGYALVVLLEKLAPPRWRQRLLALESPVALLEEALSDAGPVCGSGTWSWRS